MAQEGIQTGFRIRAATKQDTSAVDQLLARCYPKLLKADYPPSVLVLALPGMIRARPSLMTSGTYYVAEDTDGALLGAGGWTPSRKPGRGDIRHLVTDPDHLRKGVARALMEQSFEASKQAGITLLECWATRTAVPFYEAVGFHVLGPMEVTLGSGVVFPAIRMQKHQG